MSDEPIDFQPLSGDGIDFQPIENEKSVAGFGHNLVSDVKGNITGIGDLAQGLVEHPIDTIKNVPAGLIGEGKRIGLGEFLTGHPINAAQKFGNALYDKPFSTAMDVVPAIGAAGKALGIGGAAAEGAEAAEAATKAIPKDLPVIPPGAKTGAPHALFSYNDEFGPGGAPRSNYTIFGDPQDPVFQQKSPSGAGGHGSTMSKADVDALGIPVTGREPRTVGKWEPLDTATEPEAPKAAPEKGGIGQRLAARTTSQALDINPLAARKLATKAGMSPEEAVLDLGNKANELIPNLIEPLDSANSKFSKVLDAHDAAGKEIGGIVDNATKSTGGTFPEAGETIESLKQAAQNYYQVDGGDLALQKTAERLEGLQKSGKLDFDRLSQVKSAIGKGFNKTEVPPGTEEIYGIINDGIDKVINRLATENPSLGDKFSRAKEVYTVTSRLLPAMSRTAAREVAGNSMGGGILGKVVPSAIGGMLGGPVGALAGAGAKYLQEAIAPDLGKNLAYMSMKATPEMVAAVQKAFPTLSRAAAASIAARLPQKKDQKGMSQGGIVPNDVRQYVQSRAC